MENLAAALDQAGIGPAPVEMSLPLEHWQTLPNIIDKEARDLVPGLKIAMRGVMYPMRFKP